MDVTQIFVIYLVVVIVFWLLLTMTDVSWKMNGWTAFFVASIIGVIFVAVLSTGLDAKKLNNNDKTMLGVLYFISYALPIVLALCLIFGVSSKVTMVCDEASGVCDPVAAKISQGPHKTTLLFPNRA